MIDFYDGQITDILPGNLASEPAVKALSLALREGTRLLHKYTQFCYVYCNIDKLSDEVLDLLAVELRTQYYSDDLDIEAKRSLVRNTMIWYMTAGTPAAVEELVAAVFGEGEVTEWFEYGGEPYYFKIKTNATLREDMMTYFSEMIRRVKNTRSHLEAIEIHRTINQPYYAGCCVAPQYKPAAIIDGFSVGGEASGQSIYAGTAAFSGYKPAAIIDGYRESRETKLTVYASAVEVGQTHQAAVMEGLSYEGDKVSTEDAKAGAATAGTVRPAAIIDGGTLNGEVQLQVGAAAIATASQTHQAAVLEGLSYEGDKVSTEDVTVGTATAGTSRPAAITE